MEYAVIQPFQSLYNKAVGSIPASVAEKLGSTSGGTNMFFSSIVAAVVLLITITVLSKAFIKKKTNLPPSIPGGWPLLGNILQIREARPNQLFAEWAAKYGPIFHMQIGTTNHVVITSADLAKEVMVTKFNSISTRKLSTAISILTCDKATVVTSDYGEGHRMLRKMLVGHLLGPNAQKANRPIRETALSLMLNDMFAAIGGESSVVLDVRDFIKRTLFQFSMQQIFGYVPEGIYVPELGRYVKKWEMYDAMVFDMMQTFLRVDWRDFFPALSFVPNKTVEKEIYDVKNKSAYIVEALLEEQRKLIKTRGPTRCYADILLTEEKHLTPTELQMAIWEPTLQSSDTAIVTTEWAMFEIIKNPKIQERLYKELKSVVGDRMVNEDDLDKLPLLTAVIQETLRAYAPVSLLPPRYVHEDIKIGGYDVPKDWEVLINVIGINMDAKEWTSPEVWDPDRHLKNDKVVDPGMKDFRILSFGAGKRMCPGIQQAMAIIPMCIASFLLHCEWSMPPGLDASEQAHAEDSNSLTSHKLHPLMAVAKPRLSSPMSF